MLKELGINEIKEEPKIQLNKLETEKNEVSDDSKFDLEYRSLKNRFPEIKQLWRWNRTKKRWK